MANANIVSQSTTPTVGVGIPAPAAPVTGAPPPDTTPTLLLYRQAFDQALAASAALSQDDLLQVNIDVPSAVATAVGVLPKILAYRADAEKLPGFDIAQFDQLQVYAFALGHAHAKFLAASAPPEELAGLNESGMKLRDLMYSDALALANRGIIGGDRIAGFKANVGYKNIAFDLLGLSTLLRENWDKIASKTAVQLSELDEAELLGRRLMDAVGAREQAPAVVAQVQAQRQRNFTLFSQTYDQVRRAISYLRWDEDDIEQISPSLYAGRGGSRRKETPTPDPTPPSPSAPPPAVGGTAPAAPGGDKPNAKAPVATGAGVPNGNPFATAATS